MQSAMNEKEFYVPSSYYNALRLFPIFPPASRLPVTSLAQRVASLILMHTHPLSLQSPLINYHLSQHLSLAFSQNNHTSSSANFSFPAHRLSIVLALKYYLNRDGPPYRLSLSFSLGIWKILRVPPCPHIFTPRLGQRSRYPFRHIPFQINSGADGCTLTSIYVRCIVLYWALSDPLLLHSLLTLCRTTPDHMT